MTEEYFPGSAQSLSLTDATTRLAYTYECRDCRWSERIRLTRMAADFPRSTRVGDLRGLLACGRCGSKQIIVMTLWLDASTTDRMLEERGLPVWDAEDN
jgi:hypothetical protein